MISELWGKEASFSKWRKKHAELHRLAQLLTWENIAPDRLQKALTAYDEMYNTLQTREEWFYPNVEDYLITWRWITHRVYEGLRDANYIQLNTGQEAASRAVMIDTLYYISCRYQIWERPVPHDLQVFALTKYPRSLPTLKAMLTPEVAATYQPQLWALVCSLDALYEASDEKAKNRVIDAWFKEQAGGVTSSKKDVSNQLPSDFVIG